MLELKLIFFILNFYIFSLSDRIEMVLFILRYISCLILFVLGLKAPGIMQTVDYFSLNDSTNNVSSQVGIFLFFFIEILPFFG